eukprot:7087371-Lingulodinium_polyedra.AAC.1
MGNAAKALGVHKESFALDCRGRCDPGLPVLEGGKRGARLRAVRTAEGNGQTHPILRCGNCVIVLAVADQNPLGGP